jgi:hypothetical protein
MTLSLPEVGVRDLDPVDTHSSAVGGRTGAAPARPV